MFFLDLAAIVYFIFLAPVPLFSGLFQAQTKFFARFGYWNFVGTLLFWIATTLLVFRFLEYGIAARIPTTLAITILGVIITCGGFILAIIAGHTLSLATTIWLPQIDPKKYSSTLVTTGIYSRMRHPRYLAYWLMTLGLALATGFTAMWFLLLWSIAGFVHLGYLEERELQERFGAAYRDYMKNVPRFLPKFS